jgi:hypothetical protein
MPCSHQYSLGVEKYSVPHQYNLSFTDSWPEYVLDIITIEREVPDKSPVYIVYMKNLAIRNIERFSRSKTKYDVKVYMDKNLTIGFPFALGLPIAIFDLISKEISCFRK